MSNLPSTYIQDIIKKYSASKINRARQLYFAGIAPTDISESISIDIIDLGYLCFGANRQGTDPRCWYLERKARSPLSVHTYSETKPVLLKQTEMRLHKMIDNSLDNMQDNGEFFDIDAISKAASVMEKFDKITRLEENKATENIEVHQSFTLKDITEAMRQNKENNDEQTDQE